MEPRNRLIVEAEDASMVSELQITDELEAGDDPETEIDHFGSVARPCDRVGLDSIREN